MSEKQSTLNHSPSRTDSESLTASERHVVNNTKDDALQYLQGSDQEIAAKLPPDEKLDRELRRRNDFRVMPFLVACYFVTFLDKVNLNYAKIMGLTRDINLKGNEYSNVSSIFYIGALFGEVVFVHPLQRFGAAKILGCCIIGWGICTLCHAALQNFAGIVALRLISGILEAPIPPTIMLLSSQFYTRKEQALRFGLWYSGGGLAQIAGSLISYGFQWVPENAPLSSWRAMFIALGGITIFIGISVLLIVPDTPMQARFLTTEEKKRVLYHVRHNQTGIRGRKFSKHQLVEGLLDAQMWIVFMIVLLEGTGSATLISYASTLVGSFGYNEKQSALLNMPAGAVDIVSCLVCCLAVYFGCRRGLVIIAATAVGILGACLMSWLPRSDQGGLLVGLYLANVLVGATPVAYQWLLTNTAGHTKRAFVTAALTAAFSIGNIIGPLTFQAKDAPQYKPAEVSLVATWASSMVLAAILMRYYKFKNRQRRIGTDSENIAINQAFAGLTDKENLSFIYAY